MNMSEDDRDEDRKKSHENYEEAELEGEEESGDDKKALDLGGTNPLRKAEEIEEDVGTD